jgi:hypothetical protein
MYLRVYVGGALNNRFTNLTAGSLKRASTAVLIDIGVFTYLRAKAL